jgi:hypothetical protein
MTAKKNRIKMSVTINELYDPDIYQYLVGVSPRRRGFMMAELCKKGLAVENAMNDMLGDFIETWANRSQTESRVESFVESLDTPKHRLN